MKKDKQPNGKPALELVEEAVHLLRGAPVVAHLCYYVGSIPFILGLLYFWSDMSRGAFAYDRITGSSLRLAALFIWMKCWQAAATAHLRAFVLASEPPRWTPGRIWRLVTQQAALQPLALFIRPASLCILLPYPWVRAWFENAVILGDGSEGSVRVVSRNARRLASLWPIQNFRLFLWLFFYGFVVWLNVVVVLCAAPELLRIFTGIESPFTQTVSAYLNSTFIASTIGCAYLLINPVTKAAYVLRCFYGESLHSGDDLRLGMRRAVAAAAVVMLLFFAPAAWSATPAQQSAADQASVQPRALDDSITRVLKRDEFAWRLPRQEAPDKSGNFVSRFANDVFHWIGDHARAAGRWVERMLKKLFKRHEEDPQVQSSGWGGAPDLLPVFYCIIIVVVVILLAWLIWANRASFKRRAIVQAKAIPAVPDLASDDVMASQLPEDEWISLARQMMERGDFRLAIRALYLATLAHLGFRQLISIARYKSNRDYQRELRRRTGGRGELLNAFGESVSIFEEVWYGEHAATAETIGKFSSHIERIKVA